MSFDTTALSGLLPAVSAGFVAPETRQDTRPEARAESAAPDRAARPSAFARLMSDARDRQASVQDKAAIKGAADPAEKAEPSPGEDTQTAVQETGVPKTAEPVAAKSDGTDADKAATAPVTADAAPAPVAQTAVATDAVPAPTEETAAPPPQAPAATPDLLASLLAIAAQPQPQALQASAKPTQDSAGQKPAHRAQTQAQAAAPQLPLPAAAADATTVASADTAAQSATTTDFAGLMAVLDSAATAMDSAATPVRETPVAQGFALVASTPTDATYTTPAAQAQPQASLLSQTAVDNLNALNVQINKRLSEGNTKFAMELHPADLGRVDVALTIAKNGQMSAHLSFDTPVTAEVFAQHETELRHQLAQTGLQLADDALTFSSRVKPVETAVVTHTNTENRSQDSLSQNGSQSGGSQQPAQQGLSGDPQGRSHQARQAARALASANDAADAADIEAAITAAASQTRSSSRLALNLIV